MTKGINYGITIIKPRRLFRTTRGDSVKEHFLNIEKLYGDVGVQIPNSIFRDLSTEINNTNVQQVAFAYAYLVAIAFLYKYTNFVDVDNGTYIQNADIKELLGYNRTTKSIDYVIKKGGLLDTIGLTETIKNYPIRFVQHPTETINNVPVREYVAIGDIDTNDINYTIIKGIVKNRNYTIKEPLFMTTSYGDREYGTMYSYECTHKIAIYEFLTFIDGDIDIIDFLMYGYLKSKCKGYKDHMKALSLSKIIKELGMDKSTFYKHIHVLEGKDYVNVNHKGWKMNKDEIELNDYFWKGVRWGAE